MATVYYINHSGYSDDKPHYGEYDYETQVMDTGKRYKRLFETGVKQDAVDFLMQKFGLEWEEIDTL